ncbi:hypothetical protein U27_03839 [Candidatus Vecturithrix granuli]|uniref:Uncharacterized protein n=1 Tax=Vecturithrix granuli TaxID=1499967 RepID=A0A081BX20_VECG1|nr:hypothetical protein U27_03839 [Candidatus Vecturithrix granuli]
MMDSHKTFPWYLSVMYLLPVLLCITITLTMVIRYTKTASPQVSIAESELREETARADEILREQQAQDEAELSK